ncbi:MAG: type II toxin-antitoxin system Phd/YefM family antitoxin [Desulfobulbus sp.]|nr:type II toxin-antitoxin system Phd/YefM family antitoxin [Desulfobulbus sp.]
MKLATHVRPISYLKSHAAEIARDITETGEPMLITQNGEARLIVVDVCTWEQKEQTMALLKMLALGKRDMEQGRFRNAEDVFMDLDEEDLT